MLGFDKAFQGRLPWLFLVAPFLPAVSQPTTATQSATPLICQLSLDKSLDLLRIDQASTPIRTGLEKALNLALDRDLNPLEGDQSPRLSIPVYYLVSRLMGLSHGGIQYVVAPKIDRFLDVGGKAKQFEMRRDRGVVQEVMAELKQLDAVSAQEQVLSRDRLKRLLHVVEPLKFLEGDDGASLDSNAYMSLAPATFRYHIVFEISSLLGLEDPKRESFQSFLRLSEEGGGLENSFGPAMARVRAEDEMIALALICFARHKFPSDDHHFDQADAQAVEILKNVSGPRKSLARRLVFEFLADRFKVREAQLDTLGFDFFSEGALYLKALGALYDPAHAEDEFSVFATHWTYRLVEKRLENWRDLVWIQSAESTPPVESETDSKSNALRLIGKALRETHNLSLLSETAEKIFADRKSPGVVKDLPYQWAFLYFLWGGNQERSQQVFAAEFQETEMDSSPQKFLEITKKRLLYFEDIPTLKSFLKSIAALQMSPGEDGDWANVLISSQELVARRINNLEIQSRVKNSAVGTDYLLRESFQSFIVQFQTLQNLVFTDFWASQNLDANAVKALRQEAEHAYDLGNLDKASRCYQKIADVAGLRRVADQWLNRLEREKNNIGQDTLSAVIGNYLRAAWLEKARKPTFLQGRRRPR